mmetsp:Transcript_32620/g.52527  ORF Transcript_32620/g.52527 Transcript_32620/m.52527 type:complete len:158 (+) Transcript_32620:126-599(+)
MNPSPLHESGHSAPNRRQELPVTPRSHMHTPRTHVLTPRTHTPRAHVHAQESGQYPLVFPVLPGPSPPLGNTRNFWGLPAPQTSLHCIAPHNAPPHGSYFSAQPPTTHLYTHAHYAPHTAAVPARPNGRTSSLPVRPNGRASSLNTGNGPYHGFVDC